MKTGNPLRVDPTRTTTLRAAFIRDLAVRFATLRRSITRLVVEEDAFGLAADARAASMAPWPGQAASVATPGLAAMLGNATPPPAHTRNAGAPTANAEMGRWRFETSSGKVAAYQTWLKQQTDAGVLGILPDATGATPAEPWTGKYVTSAYKRGVVNAYTSFHAGDIAKAPMGFVDGGKDAFLKQAFAGPVAQGKLELLSTRTYSALKGVTAEMDKEMTRILTDGMANGKGPVELARELNKSVTGLEKRRARTIARTEVIHAHAEGQLDAFEAMNVEEVGVLAEWGTAADFKVCDLCSPLEGVVLTVAEARGLLPRHPNCRCAWLPAGVGEEMFAGKTKTKWAGPEQRLAAPGTAPTGKVTGQVWHKDEAAARLRESVKAEHPKLTAVQARAASRWAGADLTTVAGKLKPGTAAAMAEATKQQQAAARAAAAKVAKRAQAAEASYLKDVKAGWHVGDDMLGPGGLTPEGLDTWVATVAGKLKGNGIIKEDLSGLALSLEERNAILATTYTGGAGTRLQAQMDAAYDVLATKAKAKAAAGKVGAAVDGWVGEGANIKALDLADYGAVPGWEPAKGGLQSYGVLLFDNKGRILMREPAGGFGGVKWTFAKGGGTAPGTTAVAEVAEETGHVAKIFDILPRKWKGTTTNTNYFLGKAASINNALMDAETASVKWMTLEEARAAIKTGSAVDAVARDLAVLRAAFAQVQAGASGYMDDLLKSGGAALAKAEKAEALAAHGHKVKLGMAQAHYKKEKFGGITDSDWVDPYKKNKLGAYGIDKALNAKGVSAWDLPEEVFVSIKDADDVVAQKAIIDKLKAKVPPKAATVATVADEVYEPGVYGLTRSDFKVYGNVPLKLSPAGVDKVLVGKGLNPATMDSEKLAKLYMQGTTAKQKAIIDELAVKVSPKAATVADDGWPAFAREFNAKNGTASADGVSYWEGVGSEFKWSPAGLQKVLSDMGLPPTMDLPEDVFTKLMAAKNAGAQKAVIDKLGAKVAPKAATVADDVVDEGVQGFIKAKGSLPAVGELKKIKDLKGSTKPWLAEDAAGKRWVVKDVNTSGISPDHVRSESTADAVYRALGFDAPPGGIIDTAEGPMKVTEYIDKSVTLAEWRVGKTADQLAAMNREISKGFVADTLLANHDVVGMEFDNILIAAGKPWRVDNGGAFAFRAQGLKKETWGRTVKELDTMRDAKLNANTASVFSGVTPDDINNQIIHIVANREAVLAAIPQAEIRAVVAERIDDLAARLPKGVAGTVRALPAGPRRAVYADAPDLHDRAVRAKSNGVTLARDRQDIEDGNILVWEEAAKGGKVETRVFFKVTEEGSAKIRAVLGEGDGAVTMAADPIYETVLKAGKTVNHHVGDGLYNTNTLEKMKDLKAQLVSKTDPKSKHYLKQIALVEDALKKKTTLSSGLVQYPTPAVKAKATHPASLRVAKEKGEIKFRRRSFKKGDSSFLMDENQVAVKEAFSIMTDDGIAARFVPVDFSKARAKAMQGVVEVVVPGAADADTVKKALGVVNQLGVSTEVQTRAYEELLYLHRGVNIAGRAEDLTYKNIFKSTTLSDEEKVTAIKGWVNKNMGVDVSKVASYDPAGRAMHVDGSGFRYWERWDLPAAKVAEEMKDYSVVHYTGNLYDSPRGAVASMLDGVLDSGGEITPTASRIRKGIKKAVTSAGSQDADIESGGASYLYTRIVKTTDERNSHGIHFRVSALARQDAITHSSDRYGALAPIRGTTTKTFKDVTEHSSNETLFKNGLSVDDIDFIRVHDAKEVEDVVAVFEKHGMGVLPDGRPVRSIIEVTGKTPKLRKY